jgi:hypothetical protein
MERNHQESTTIQTGGIFASDNLKTNAQSMVQDENLVAVQTTNRRVLLSNDCEGNNDMF